MKKTFLKKPWIVGIGTSVFATLISSIILSLVQKINIIKSVITVIKFLFSIIIKILFFKISVWIIIIGILILILVLYIISRFQDVYIPDYNHDRYSNWSFKWKINISKDGWSISHLRPVCECGCELNKDEQHFQNSWHLYCPNCRREYPYLYHQNYKDAEIYFEHKIQQLFDDYYNRDK